MLIIDEQLRAVKGRGWQVKGKVLTEVLREASGWTWLSHMDVTARLSYPPGIGAAGASTGGVSGDSPWPAGWQARGHVSKCQVTFVTSRPAQLIHSMALHSLVELLK